MQMGKDNGREEIGVKKKSLKGLKFMVKVWEPWLLQPW